MTQTYALKCACISIQSKMYAHFVSFTCAHPPTSTTNVALWNTQQRGCPKPADADDRTKYAASFEVPLRSVALTSSTYFGAMEVCPFFQKKHCHTREREW